MRSMLVGFLLLAACGGSSMSNEKVSLRFSGSNAMPSPGGGFDSSMTSIMQDGTDLTLTATTATARVDVQLDAPTTVPLTVNIGERHLAVSYTLIGSRQNAAWASNTGSITVETLAPYTVTFNHLEMIPAGGGASGAFYLDGNAKF
jgi:hypothetical protein